MYIRRTKTSSGESYYSDRLVHSERFGSKVRQRTLLNLGHHFAVEQIGRLKENSHGIRQHHQIEFIPDDNGLNAKEIRWQHTPVKGSQITDPGIYCLRSNVTDWDEETMWRTYVTLTDLEAVFRSLKSELGLRPIYHHKEVRSDGHLLITLLAYHMVQFIHRRLKECGTHVQALWIRT